MKIDGVNENWFNYKKKDKKYPKNPIMRQFMLKKWLKRNRIKGFQGCFSKPITDGMIDSIVCATIGYLYHWQPERIENISLSHDKELDLRGYAPFVVLKK